MIGHDTSPLVSVIIPSFNQGAYIRASIDSVLAQDYRPLEILVMDGASKDETVEVLRSYGELPELKWVSEPDRGPVEAVNKGLAAARGRIAGIQSSDDVYYPGAISAAVAEFGSDPRIGLVYGDADCVNAAGEVVSRNQVGIYSLNRLLSRGTYVPQCSAFFDVQRARDLRGWDERFPYCPDTDLWFKLALTSRVRKIDRTLGATRAHPGQRNHEVDRIVQSYRSMILASPELQRARWVQRRAARAGLHQLALRYAGTRSHNSVAYSLWKAVFAYPPILWGGSIPRHRLIPEYFRLAAFVGRAKRFFGGGSRVEA